MKAKLLIGILIVLVFAASPWIDILMTGGSARINAFLFILPAIVAAFYGYWSKHPMVTFFVGGSKYFSASLHLIAMDMYIEEGRMFPIYVGALFGLWGAMIAHISGRREKHG